MSTQPKIITKVDDKSLNVLTNDISSHGCIILYHWDNCGYCRNFMPIWDILKDKYGHIKQFYEIEFSTIRQAPEVFKSIKSYPTIVAYVGNGSEKVKFEDTRNMENLSSFIEKHVPDYNKSESKSKSEPKTKSKPKSEPKTKSKPKTKKNK
jgi:thiol-disulfide isomerase/thioredoxin